MRKTVKLSAPFVSPISVSRAYHDTWRRNSKDFFLQTTNIYSIQNVLFLKDFVPLNGKPPPSHNAPEETKEIPNSIVFGYLLCINARGKRYPRPTGHALHPPQIEL